jgi:hypothetical protein
MTYRLFIVDDKDDVFTVRRILERARNEYFFYPAGKPSVGGEEIFSLKYHTIPLYACLLQDYSSKHLSQKYVSKTNRLFYAGVCESDAGWPGISYNEFGGIDWCVASSDDDLINNCGDCEKRGYWGEKGNQESAECVVYTVPGGDECNAGGIGPGGLVSDD